MQVSVETLEGLKRRLTITIPAEKVQTAYNSRLNKISQTAKIDGFRPGKVPKSVIEKRFAGNVMQEITGELIRETLDAAINEKELRVAGYPQIDLDNKNPLVGQPLEYKAEVEVFPEIKPAELTGVSIVKKIAEVQDSDVDKTVDKLRQQSAEFNQTEEAAADNDRMTIDYVGTIDGEAFEGGSANDVPVTIGSHSMIPGFEEGLVGMKQGDNKKLDLKFPDDYHSKDHAGKNAIFDVTVKKVEKSTLPEIDEEFLKKFNVESLDKLKEDIKKNLERDCEQLVKNKLKQAVIDKLLEGNEFDIPSALVAGEINRLKQQAVQQFGAQSKEQQEMLMQRLPDDMFKAQAEKSVRVGLLFAEMIKARDLKVDADKMRETVEKMAANYEDPEQAVSWYYSQKQVLAEIEHLVLEEQLIDAILDSIEVQEEKVDFEALTTE